MGIPSYFRKIVKEYSGVTFWDDQFDVDHFFIDFNAMIYTVILNIENKHNLSPIEFENQLLNKTIEHLEHLITHIIRPKKSLIIAMDGPPPRAKMV